MKFEFPAIGIIHSCFTEKFGIPRQSRLVPLARARLELLPPYNDPAAVDGLESCTHLWVQFVFHKNKRNTLNDAENWKPKVKPPRLGGNKTLGVFATRSPTRPSPIGLSVVKLEKIIIENEKLFLELSGVDILDGTPVLDIKPYVPYADKIDEAQNHFASAEPELMSVVFEEAAQQFLQRLVIQDNPLIKDAKELRELIIQILQQDPRPQYQAPDENTRYAMRLMNWDVRWICVEERNIFLIKMVEIIAVEVDNNN